MQAPDVPVREGCAPREHGGAMARWLCLSNAREKGRVRPKGTDDAKDAVLGQALSGRNPSQERT
eukprot:scaffold738_cov340-Pavlova_lutheri.AAC.13